MATPASFVWVQVYYEGQEKPDGQVVKIKPAPEDVDALTEAVKNKKPNALSHCDASHLYVYLPGTKPAFDKKNSIDPGKTLEDLIAEYKSKQIPPPTSSAHPLIVVAPPPQQQLAPPTKKQKVLYQLKLPPESRKAAPVPFHDDSCWEEIVNTEVFRNLQVVDNNNVTKGWRTKGDDDSTVMVSNLFLRKELTDAMQTVDEFLSEDQTTYERLYVRGAPGSGKTSFFLWHACQSLSSNKNRKVLIVQYRESGTNEIMIVDHQSENVRRFRRPGNGRLDSSELYGILDQLLVGDFPQDLDYFIFDGVRQVQETCTDVMSMLVNRYEKKCIFVTSLRFDIHMGDCTYDIDQYMTICSWDLQDYKDAVDAMKLDRNELNELFKEDEDDSANEDDSDSEEELSLHDLIDRKYFYAGGSARLMFECSMKEVTDELEESFRNMNQQDWKDFAELIVLEKTKPVVSTLLQVVRAPRALTGVQAFPLSKYVLNHAHEQCGAALVSSVMAAAALL